jgi:anaerobic ribonucleoside-triphosphate reductase activating protein
MRELLAALEKPHIHGLSILGGDPFEPENRGRVLDICKDVRKRFGDSRTIWIWTGYMWEDLRDEPVLNYIDVLVDGPFIESKRDLRLFYRGSRNQRVIDIPKTLERGCAIRYEGTQKWK